METCIFEAHKRTYNNYHAAIKALSEGKKVWCSYCDEYITDENDLTAIAPACPMHTCMVDCVLIEGEAPILDRVWCKKFRSHWHAMPTD